MNDAERNSIEQKWGEALKELNPSGPCLTARELIEVAERGDRARNYGRHVEHLALCGVCREAVREMVEADVARAAKTPPHPRWFTLPRLAFAVPAVAAAIFAVVLLARSGWLGGFGSKGPLAKNDRSHQPESNPKIENGSPKVGNDGTRIVQRGPESRPGPVSNVRPNDNAPRIRTTIVASNWKTRGDRHIYNGTDLPDDIQFIAKSFTAGPGVVRGGDEGRRRMRPHMAGPSEPKVVESWLDEPLEGNSALVDSKPEFRLATDDAKGRTARLFGVEEDGSRTELTRKLTASGGDMPGLPLALSLNENASLKPGREYVLEVAAKTTEIVGGIEVESEKTTSWRFRMLGEREERLYRWAKDNQAKLPVAAALVLHRLGQFGDAEAICKELDKSQAGRKQRGKVQMQPVEVSPVWQQWRKAIRRGYDQRVSEPAK